VSKFLLLLEKLFYLARDFLWSYPDLFLGRESLVFRLSKIYKKLIPLSHILVSFSLTILIISFITSTPLRLYITLNREKTLVEGVITGANEFGETNKITSINPIISSSLQAERDIVELIYEPLLKVVFKAQPGDKFDQEFRLYLAKEINTFATGAEYQIVLRDDVYWHDGTKFSVDDVIATFDLVASLSTPNANSQVLSQMLWEPVGNSIRICTKVTQQSKSCSEPGEKPFFSNFLELISVKILPKHKIGDINRANFDSSIPEIFRSPIGTGPYKFSGVSENSVNLTYNDLYYQKDFKPGIKSIQFKFFKSIEKALNALKASEIHSFATPSSEFKREMSSFPNISLNVSPVLYNQYWAIYINLRKDPLGNPIGSKALQDPKVRQALHYALNREEMISISMDSLGKPASGPIPSISSFFNPEVDFSEYNIKKAEELLDEAGWYRFSTNKYRVNEAGEELYFKLYFVDSIDRRNLANYIKIAYERVGIKVDISSNERSFGLTLQELNSQYLNKGLFDAVIYGVSTFIDPDRFELFHSSQSKYPGLNISGYISSEVSKVVGQKNGKKDVVDVPKVDKILEEARSLDPVELYNIRKDRYYEFQKILHKDMPLVFLFHPQFIYYTNKKVVNVNLSRVNSIEERFLNISDFILVE